MELMMELMIITYFIISHIVFMIKLRKSNENFNIKLVDSYLWFLYIIKKIRKFMIFSFKKVSIMFEEMIATLYYIK